MKQGVSGSKGYEVEVERDVSDDIELVKTALKETIKATEDVLNENL